MNLPLSILPSHLGCNFQYTPALEKRMAIYCLESGWIRKYAPSEICTPRPSRLPQGAYFPSRQCIITLLLPRKVMDPKPQSQNLSAIPKVSGKGVPPPPKDLLPKTAFLYPYASFRPFFGALWLWTSPWRAQKYIKKLNLYDNTFQSLAEILHQHHVGFVNGCNYCRGTEMNCGNVG